MAADATIQTLQIEIDVSVDSAIDNVNRLADALNGMKSSFRKSSGSSGFTKNINSLKNYVSGAIKPFGLLKKAIGAIGFHQIAKGIGNSVQSMNEYIENVNLFQVSMEEFYEEAAEYANLVSEKLGVDPSQWMRTQGVFMSMGKGFGMANEQAYALSEGLTELSYDISSLYNEDIERAALRLQSALAGEIEPIRRLGISISQATLEEYALSKGIQESVSKMTEQEKALLRSIKLIEDAGKIGAIGDFAKTLESPANALRVLNQQLTQFKRAIGSVFLPAVIQVLPYIQAFVSLITDAVKALAVLVRFKMPEWDNSDWEQNYSGATSVVEETTAAVKELKRQTIGIDELNILQDNKSSGGGAGGGVSDWAKDITIPELWDKQAISEVETKAQEIKERLKELLPLISGIGTALLLWTISPSIFSGLKTLYESLGFILGRTAALTPAAAQLVQAFKFGGVVAVIATMVARFVDLYQNSELFRTGIERIGEIISGVFSFAVEILGDVWTQIKNVGLSMLELLPDDVKEAIISGLTTISDWLKQIDVDWKDLAIAAAGFGLLFVPGGKILGAVLLGFEAITLAVRAFGGVSEETWESIKNKTHEVFSVIKETVYGVFDGVIVFLSGVFTNNFSLTFEGLSAIVESVIDGIGKLFETLFGVNIVNVAKDWFENHIKPWFTIEKWKELGKLALDGFFTGLSNLGDRFSGWWNDLKENFGSKATSFGDYTSSSSRSILSGVDAFAAGGFPDHGQLFIARESGPELVGQIGGRTAVANNDQIVDGIAMANEGVINAVMAMGNMIVTAVNNKDTATYLDGKKMSRALYPYQNAQQARHGTSLVNK